MFRWHISFSSGTFSKVHVGGRPLQLYHYLPTPKKFSFWTREATLPLKEVKSGGKRSGILGSVTSFAVHWVAALTCTERNVNKTYNNGPRSGSQKSMRAGGEKWICNNSCLSCCELFRLPGTWLILLCLQPSLIVLCHCDIFLPLLRMGGFVWIL